MPRAGLQNLRELEKAHKRFMELSKKDVAKSLEKVGQHFLSRLQVGTPKEFGRAQNGWIPVVDASPSSWMPPAGKTSYGLMSFPVNKVKFDSIIWISNNVPYIERLDEGHSQQAPEGFTDHALMLTRLYVETEINKLNRRKY